ncbi:MAG: hypothetical protein WBA74_10995 [Cyclobacteriaceae bacterium]
MKSTQKAKYIWYNPTSQEYEMGDAVTYKKKKTLSAMSQDFTLLYKLSATSTRLGQKLISELNKARKTQDESEKFFELNLAS